VSEVVPCEPANQGGSHGSQMIHGDPHGEGWFQIGCVGDAVYVCRESDAAEENKIVHTIQDIERRTMVDQSISGEDENESDVTGTQHDAFAKAVDEAAQQGRCERDQDLVDEDENHRRLHRHSMNLHEGENSEGDEHLLAAALQEVQSIVEVVSATKNEALRIGVHDFPTDQQQGHPTDYGHEPGDREHILVEALQTTAGC